MLWIGDDNGTKGKEAGQLWIGVEVAGKVVAKSVESLYCGIEKNAKLIWEAVSSCFGSGLWRELLPWKDSDAWKDD